MEIGLYNFGDSMPDAATGEQIDQGTRIRNLLEEIEVADAAGLDVIALGEHHRPEFAVSSPSTVLAAAATRICSFVHWVVLLQVFSHGRFRAACLPGHQQRLHEQI